MNEPKWTTHRVTMPEDMALDYLERLLPIVNKEFLDPGYPIALSMAIDKIRAPLPDNKALTVEELRGMGGKPVWVVFDDDSATWLLVDAGNIYEPLRLATNWGAQITLEEHKGHIKVIYRRPPAEED